VTVSFVCHGDDVLLLRHPSDGDRFAGQWNGIGGHVEAGEDVRAAARRELREEAGIDVPGLVLRGVVHESGLVGAAHVLFVFTGRVAHRDVSPEPGVTLGWQPLDRLDALPLVHDVALLLPRALDAQEVFFATESFDGGDACTSFRFDQPGDRDEPEARDERRERVARVG
jgi:8-oxo-dGTP diphosphatase